MEERRLVKLRDVPARLAIRSRLKSEARKTTSPHTEEVIAFTSDLHRGTIFPRERGI